MTNLKRSGIATVLTLTLVSGLAACGTNDGAKPAEAAPSASPSASPSDTEPKGKGASGNDTNESPANSKPSASPSPKGPYKPATPKRPAQNVPVPGPLPEVAKEESKAGQVAFIEHWFKEFNYGLETNKLRPEFWEMTSKSCKYCRTVQNALNFMKKQKSWAIGGDLTARNIRPSLRQLDSGIYEVQLSIKETERKRYVPDKNKPVGYHPPTSLDRAFVELRRVDGQWQLEGLYQIED